MYAAVCPVRAVERWVAVGRAVGLDMASDNCFRDFRKEAERNACTMLYASQFWQLLQDVRKT